MPDLTTLKAVKAWLGVSSDADDQLLGSLISQVSGVILSYLGRQGILRRQYTEQFTGTGSDTKMLRNYPVVDIISVNVGCLSVQVGGFWIGPDDGAPPGHPQSLHLTNTRFERLPCKIVYEAGYFVSDEPHAAAVNVNVLAENGNWARDEGVSYAGGAAMIKVAANPAQGQYALNAKIPGCYIFNAADNGAQVLIDYSYVPNDLELACIELVGERYRYKSRIGQSSQSMNGATTSAYSLKDMPDFTRLALQPFRRMVPV